MNTGTITAVGIDVSKHKSTVAARRPGGEVVLLPFDVEHTAEGLKKLITKLRELDGEIRIVMEHTGMYWRPIAMTLKEAGFYVSVVNAILMFEAYRTYRPCSKCCALSNDVPVWYISYIELSEKCKHVGINVKQ